MRLREHTRGGVRSKRRLGEASTTKVTRAKNAKGFIEAAIFCCEGKVKLRNFR